MTAGTLGLIASVIAGVLPVLVGAWQAQLHASASEAGFVAAMELFAQVAGTLAFISLEWPWRRAAGLGLAFMAIGNAAAGTSATLASLLAARALAGFGGGAVRALCMKCLTRAVSPGRAFAIYAALQVGIAASVTALIPRLLATASIRVPFVGFAGLCAAAIGLIAFLPAQPASRSGGATWRSLTRTSLCTLSALFTFFLGQAAVWTFLDPLGRAEGIASSAIEHALTWLNVAGLLGSLAIGALAHRANALLAVCCLLLVTLGSTYALFHTHSASIFILAACAFYFAWCASFPFQFAIIARADEAGATGAAAPAVDTLGLASGAAITSALIPLHGIGIAGLIGASASLAAAGGYALGCSVFRRTIHAPLGAAPRT